MRNDEKLLNLLLGLFSKRKTQILLMILLLFLDSLVFILPYYINSYTIPVGWDTPWYIRNMRLIEEQGFFSLFMKTQGINFFSILEYLFALTFNISFITSAMDVPIIIAILFPLVNFQIVKKLTKSNGLSLLAMLFTIIDYNIVRMAGIFHRNLFSLLLIEIAVFLVLPNLLKLPSKKSFFAFFSLAVIAGISQTETFAIAIIVLSLLLFFYLKNRLVKLIKFLLLCILVPASIVILLQAPFLSSFVEAHMIFDPTYTTLHSTRKNLTAQPWNYAMSLGMGLIPLFIVGTYVLFRNAVKHQKPLFQLLLFWNLTAIASSFLPVFKVRVPGWRLLLILTFPPVAILGFAKLFIEGRAFSNVRAPKAFLVKLLFLATLLAISLTGIISTQQSRYRPWIKEDLYHKLVWISDYEENKACIVVLHFDRGAQVFDYAWFYRNWIWAIIGTRTNVYFGDVESLLESKPTSFENPHMNVTSHVFWTELENFTLEGKNVYLIKELYENPLNETFWVEVETGIYSWSPINK